MNRLLKAVLACGLVAVSGDAGAYVRSRSNECNPLYWAQQCVFVTLDQNGATNAGVTDMPFADVETATKNAIGAWAKALPGAGSFMQLRYTPATKNWETALDYVPVIKFRYDTCRDQCGSSQWCRPGVNGAKASCYDRSAAALTTVFFYDTPMDRTRDGQIIDADIELNAVHNHFYNADGAPPSDAARSPTDLWNTLTHELGHLQGLEHTCLASSTETAACTVDQNGNRAPLCLQVLADPTSPTNKVLINTTMFATAQPKETLKRVPKADDLAGVAAAYPNAELLLLGSPKDPYNCIAPTDRDPKQTPFLHGPVGCSTVPVTTAPSAGASGFLAGLAALLLLRRRRA